MPKFTLIGEHTDLNGNPNGTKIHYEFHVEHIDNVLEHFDLFLRGCGYNPLGVLDYSGDEPEEFLEHSEYYFDTERNK